MLKLEVENRFKKDIQRDKKSGKYSEDDFKLLKCIIQELGEEKIMNQTFKRHKLTNNLKGYESIHLKSDWVLIFKISGDILTLVMLGTHNQVYKNRY